MHRCVGNCDETSMVMSLRERVRSGMAVRLLRARRFLVIDVMWLAGQRWRVQGLGSHVTLIGYFSFVSVFPLLLVFASVVTIVTEVSGWDIERLTDSVVGQLPLVGDQVISQAGTVSGSAIAVVVGGLVALWAATKAFMKIFDMNDEVWGVAADDRESFARRRVRSLMGLVVVGFRAIVATAATSVVTVIGVPVVGAVVGIVLALVVNVTVLLGLLQLSSRRLPWRSIAPGAVVGGILFWLFQVFGTTLVQVSIEGETGPFTPTFALIAWLTLHATVITAMAVLNATLASRAVLTRSLIDP